MSRSWIEYRGEYWRVSHLAERHHISVGTLAARIKRFGDDEIGVNRALCTGILSRSESGGRGKMKSPWTASINTKKA